MPTLIIANSLLEYPKPDLHRWHFEEVYPEIDRWLGRSRCIRQWAYPTVSYHAPFERIWARYLGWDYPEGLFPFAHLASLSLHDQSHTGWAFLHLCHWQVVQGDIVCHPVTSPDELVCKALFLNAKPYFEEDGLQLVYYKPLTWLVQSPELADLPTTSFSHVLGQSILSKILSISALPESQHPIVKKILRLQSEMQLLFGSHAMNAHTVTPINSFWMSGTGVLKSRSPEVTMQAPDLMLLDFYTEDQKKWSEQWIQLESILAASSMETDIWFCGQHYACQWAPSQFWRKFIKWPRKRVPSILLPSYSLRPLPHELS
ncbi:MAG: hypothetical protein QM520_00750 [Gammaproteobacteria bacterium]|nr:hypothetical protein [Gammaproteobacteria bacterium]